jgi:NADH pyrophosphatase NudC (nudix superfamily)
MRAKRRAAPRSGENELSCALCDRRIAAHAPVWRVLLSSRTIDRLKGVDLDDCRPAARRRVVSICSRCSRARRYHLGGSSPTPCAGCGRPVHEHDHGYATVCSTRCRVHARNRRGKLVREEQHHGSEPNYTIILDGETISEQYP